MQDNTVKLKIKASVHPLFYVGMAIANFGVWIVNRFNIIVSAEVIN